MAEIGGVFLANTVGVRVSSTGSGQAVGETPNGAAVRWKVGGGGGGVGGGEVAINNIRLFVFFRLLYLEGLAIYLSRSLARSL